MTSKFNIDNRELLQRISCGEAVVGIDFGDLIVRELAAFRLAAMDSEPVAWLAIYHGEVYDEAIGITRSVVEAQADHYGWESALTEIIPLYRHAQQPVVPDDVLDALQKVARIRLDLNDFDGDRRGIADCLGDAEEALIEVVNRRAAMLQGAENTESRCGIQTAPALDSFKKNADARCGNSPAIPEGYVMVPKEPTAQMYDAGDRQMTTKQVWDAMLAAAPQSIGGDPATVPGKWIPVSERMPGSQEWVIVFAKWANQQVLCWDDVQNRWTDFEDQSYYADMFTHWMPLPATPQEPKP
ncbi:DUF551 domain-containing protein [Klebsiella pasteurii]|nr:DUF551 domain-containing protein [Klebsiella pasteurii]MDM4218433.1 DUF551 domain-containing protein [Klebsiella pasteurii]